MRLELTELPFEAEITETFTLIDNDVPYNIEVVISYGYGLEETEVDVAVLEHGLSNDKIDEITDFVKEQFKNVKYNRELCK